MELGKEIKTIKARVPILIIFLSALCTIIAILGFTHGILDNYAISSRSDANFGIPAKYFVVGISILSYINIGQLIIPLLNDSSIKIYEHGIKINDFESTFENLVIRKNKFDNGETVLTYKGYLSRKDRDFLLELN